MERSALGGKRKGRIAAGLLGLLIAAGYTVQASQLPYGTAAQPGAAIFPMIVGVAFMVISLITIWEAWRTTAVTGDFDLPIGADRRRLLLMIAILVAYVALLPWLGQVVASALFVIAMLRVLTALPWLRIVAYGLAIALLTYLFFGILLGVQLPRGPLEYALGL